jgi:hypothetical protein
MSLYPDWYKRAKTFARRRMNPEQNDDSLVAITLQECYRLQDALTRCDTIADMGIFETTKWSLKAYCYMHGWQARDVETTELVPRHPRIDCWSCGRTLMVTARVKEQDHI